MKRFILIFSLLLFGAQALMAQKYVSRNGHIWFYSHTPVEDIEAHNRQAASVLNTETGDLVFQVLIKAFTFEKALMQEHFNEKYMESTKYPKATFQGKVSNFEEVDMKKDGTYPVKVAGTLTIHGVAKEVSVDGQIIVAGPELTAKAKFPAKVADYGIEIPSVVRENIAKEVEITVDLAYKKM
ncbi:MAG: YceI family protein [Bacteroidota bacterium]